MPLRPEDEAVLAMLNEAEVMLRIKDGDGYREIWVPVPLILAAAAHRAALHQEEGARRVREGEYPES